MQRAGLGFHAPCRAAVPTRSQHPRLEPLLLQPKPPLGTKPARRTNRLMPSSARGDATFRQWGLRWSSRSKKRAIARPAGEMGAPCTPKDASTLLPSDAAVIGLCHP